MPRGLTGAACSVGGFQRVFLPLQVSHLPAEGPANEVTRAGGGACRGPTESWPGLGGGQQGERRRRPGHCAAVWALGLIAGMPETTGHLPAS